MGSVSHDQYRGLPISFKKHKKQFPSWPKGNTYASDSNMLKYRNNFLQPSFGPERTLQLDANIPPQNPVRLTCGYLRRVETSQANKGKVF